MWLLEKKKTIISTPTKSLMASNANLFSHPHLLQRAPGIAPLAWGCGLGVLLANSCQAMDRRRPRAAALELRRRRAMECHRPRAMERHLFPPSERWSVGGMGQCSVASQLRPRAMEHCGRPDVEPVRPFPHDVAALCFLATGK